MVFTLGFILLLAGAVHANSGYSQPCYGSTEAPLYSPIQAQPPCPTYQLAPLVLPSVKAVPQIDLTNKMKELWANWLKMKADLKSKMFSDLKSLKSSFQVKSPQPAPLLLWLPVYKPKAVYTTPAYTKPTSNCCRCCPVYKKPTTTTTAYPIYTKPAMTCCSSYDEPSTKPYSVYAPPTTRSYYVKPSTSYTVYKTTLTTAYPVYVKPYTTKPPQTAICCMNMPISYPKSKYDTISNVADPKYVADMYKSGSELNLASLNTLPQLDLNNIARQLSANSTSILQCISLYVCEHSCDAQIHGNVGRKLVSLLPTIKLSPLPGFDGLAFQNATTLGNSFRSSCQQCATKYPNCKHGLGEVLKTTA